MFPILETNKEKIMLALPILKTSAKSVQTSRVVSRKVQRTNPNEYNVLTQTSATYLPKQVARNH